MSYRSDLEDARLDAVDRRRRWNRVARAKRRQREASSPGSHVEALKSALEADRQAVAEGADQWSRLLGGST